MNRNDILNYKTGCMKIIMAWLFITVTVFSATAQQTPAETEAGVRAVMQTVKAGYVFPEMALKMEQFILGRLSAGAYASFNDKKRLAEQLTLDLQSVSHDAHLRVAYSPSIDEEENNVKPRQDQEEERGFLDMLKKENYGVKSYEILEGNTGYLNLRFFGPLEYCADTLIKAIQALAYTESLIIDLRECGGSMDPNAIPFFSGYFFEKPVHLNDLYFRTTGDTTPYWSYGWVPGKKLYNKPIYILTSGRTFSGAEELAYDYQNLKRAVIIGEPTGGGANPGGDVRADSSFVVFVPNGRAINPITKTNWEGVGVKPDTLVAAPFALYAARLMDYKTRLKKEKSIFRKTALESAITEMENNRPAMRKHHFVLKGFADAQKIYVAGSFNYWSAKSTAMQKTADGWEVTVDTAPGKVPYKFIVDGKWIKDPANPVTQNDHGNINSVVTVR